MSIRFIDKLLLSTILPEDVLDIIIEGYGRLYARGLAHNPTLGSRARRLLGLGDDAEVIQDLLVYGNHDALEIALMVGELDDENIRVIHSYWSLSRADFRRVVDAAAPGCKVTIKKPQRGAWTSYHGPTKWEKSPGIMTAGLRTGLLGLSVDNPEWTKMTSQSGGNYDVGTFMVVELGDASSDESRLAWRYFFSFAENQPRAVLADVISAAKQLANCDGAAV